MDNTREYDSMDMADYEYSIASQISYMYYDNGNDSEATQRALDTYPLEASVAEKQKKERRKKEEASSFCFSLHFFRHGFHGPGFVRAPAHREKRRGRR